MLQSLLFHAHHRLLEVNFKRGLDVARFRGWGSSIATGFGLISYFLITLYSSTYNPQRQSQSKNQTDDEFLHIAHNSFRGWQLHSRRARNHLAVVQCSLKTISIHGFDFHINYSLLSSTGGHWDRREGVLRPICPTPMISPNRSFPTSQFYNIDS